MLPTDEYVAGSKGINGDDQEWYVNTTGFYRQIRGLKIEITQMRSTQEVTCVHYQVGQAIRLQFVKIDREVWHKTKWCRCLATLPEHEMAGQELTKTVYGEWF